MKLSLKTVARFTRQMATYQESFVDIRRALNSLSEHSADSRLSASLRRVWACVQDGDSLFEAFSKEGDRYPLIFLRMTKVGEESGTLATIYHQLADYLDQQVSMRRRFLSRLIYPFFMVVALIFVHSLVSAVFSAFAPGAENTTGYGAIEEQFFRNLLRDTSILGTVIFVFVALRFLFVGRSVTDALVLYVPGLAGSFRKLVLARFSLSMHLMTGSAIGMPEAVRESAKATNNAYVAWVLEKASRRIEEGTPLTPALRDTGLFPPDFIDIVDVAEESGTVSESLKRVSVRYAEDAEIALNRLVSAFAWGIYLFIAGVMAYYIVTLYASYIGRITGQMGQY